MPKGSTYCASCGAMNTAAARFCVQCGAAMAAKAEPEKKNVCPSCGAEPAPGAHFCAKCGSALAAPPAGIRKPPPAPRSPAADLRSANAFLEAVPLWVWVGLLGLALVLSYFIFSENRTNPAPAAGGDVASTTSVAENELPVATAVSATPTKTSAAPSPGWQQASLDELYLWLPGEFFVATSVEELHELAQALRDAGNGSYADYIEGVGDFTDVNGTIDWFEQGKFHLYAAPLTDGAYVNNVTINHTPLSEQPLSAAINALQGLQSDYTDVIEDLDFYIPGYQTYAARLLFYVSSDDPDYITYTYLIVREDLLWEISIATAVAGTDYSEADVWRIIDSVDFN